MGGSAADLAFVDERLAFGLVGNAATLHRPMFGTIIVTRRTGVATDVLTEAPGRNDHAIRTIVLVAVPVQTVHLLPS